MFYILLFTANLSIQDYRSTEISLTKRHMYCYTTWCNSTFSSGGTFAQQLQPWRQTRERPTRVDALPVQVAKWPPTKAAVSIMSCPPSWHNERSEICCAPSRHQPTSRAWWTSPPTTTSPCPRMPTLGKTTSLFSSSSQARQQQEQEQQRRRRQQQGGMMVRTKGALLTLALARAARASSTATAPLPRRWSGASPTSTGPRRPCSSTRATRPTRAYSRPCRRRAMWWCTTSSSTPVCMPA